MAAATYYFYDRDDTMPMVVEGASTKAALIHQLAEAMQAADGHRRPSKHYRARVRLPRLVTGKAVSVDFTAADGDYYQWRVERR